MLEGLQVYRELEIGLVHFLSMGMFRIERRCLDGQCRNNFNIVPRDWDVLMKKALELGMAILTTTLADCLDAWQHQCIDKDSEAPCICSLMEFWLT